MKKKKSNVRPKKKKNKVGRQQWNGFIDALHPINNHDVFLVILKLHYTFDIYLNIHMIIIFLIK